MEVLEKEAKVGDKTVHSTGLNIAAMSGNKNPEPPFQKNTTKVCQCIWYVLLDTIEKSNHLQWIDNESSIKYLNVEYWRFLRNVSQ